jgi:peptidyl-prolyl cis-trans isomerase SurA
MTSLNRTRTVLGLTTAAALLALTACGGGDSSSDPESADSSTSQGQASADLEGIPEVVAEVNGEEVTRDEFAPIYQAQLEQATMQAQQMGGKAPDEAALEKLQEQVADNLVDTELLAQEFDARGLEVSDDDVDAELASLAEQNQLGSADELLAALEKQGTSEEQVRDQVETQVMVEKLVNDEAGPVKPSDKQLRAIYQRAKEQQQQLAEQGGQQQEIPSYADVKPQLEEQAASQRVGTVAQKLVDALRKDADITINL